MTVRVVVAGAVVHMSAQLSTFSFCALHMAHTPWLYMYGRVSSRCISWKAPFHLQYAFIDLLLLSVDCLTYMYRTYKYTVELTVILVGDN